MPRTRTTKPSTDPFFGSGLLFDVVASTPGGKLTGQGAICVFWAWGFPCSRQCWALMTIFNLRKGSTPILIRLRKGHSRQMNTVGSGDVTTSADNACATTPMLLTYQFQEPGEYFLVATLGGYRSKLEIPFAVIVRDWPTFTEAERQFARKNPGSVPGARATVHCSKCSHAYIFEENLSEDTPLPGGVQKFPESGKFECIDCGETVHLRDIQGQLRSSLKQILSQTIRGH